MERRQQLAFLLVPSTSRQHCDMQDAQTSTFQNALAANNDGPGLHRTRENGTCPSPSWSSPPPPASQVPLTKSLSPRQPTRGSSKETAAVQFFGGFFGAISSVVLHFLRIPCDLVDPSTCQRSRSVPPGQLVWRMM